MVTEEAWPRGRGRGWEEGEVAPPYSLPPAARGAASMSTAAFHISNLLEKMTSSDKDFRCALRRPGASFQGPQPVLVSSPIPLQTPAGTARACLGLPGPAATAPPPASSRLCCAGPSDTPTLGAPQTLQ